MKVSEEEKKQQEEAQKEDEQKETDTQGVEKKEDTQVDEDIATDEPKADETNEELEKLKSENEELKNKISSQSVAPVEQGKIVTEDQAIQFFSNMTDTDFEQNYSEKFNGKTRDQIISDLKLTKISNQNEQLQARLVLNDTLDDEISKNSRLTKLKGGIKEFFDKFVSNKDKSDTSKIKQHLKDAEIYARGKYNMNNPSKVNKAVSTDNISPNKSIGSSTAKEKEEDENNIKVSVGNRVMNIQKNKRGNTTEFVYDTLEDEPRFD